MSGIQVHTSDPINNANSETLPAASDAAQTRNDFQSLPVTSNNRVTNTTTPSRTVPAGQGLSGPNPPALMPGQVPSTSNNLTATTSQLAPINPPLQPQQSMPVQQDLSNPPGYQQQQASFQDRPVVEESNSSLFSTSANRSAGLLGVGSESTGVATGEDTPVWNTAKSWVQEAGRKLSTAEANVWKLVNGQK